MGCLPEPWKDQLWAGEVKSTKQAAEQSAAEMCLQTILNDPMLKEKLEEKPAAGKGILGGSGKKKKSSKGSGKSALGSFVHGFAQRALKAGNITDGDKTEAGVTDTAPEADGEGGEGEEGGEEKNKGKGKGKMKQMMKNMKNMNPM